MAASKPQSLYIIDEFIRIECQFHETLANYTGNKLLAALIYAVREVVNEKLVQTLKNITFHEDVISDRIALFKALKENNREKAERCAEDHMRMSQVLYGYQPLLIRLYQSADSG